MDDLLKAEYEEKCQNLRGELKRWEVGWAKDNGGRRPGREDIKRNPEIAQKYRDYQKSRDVLDGKVPPPAKDQPKPRKRKSDQAAAPSQTPSKRSKHIETPSKGQFIDEQLEETPTISRKLFSPSAVTSLGPTPQRDGRVLGLFDLMDDAGGGTPSKSRVRHIDEEQPNTHVTPRKPTMSDNESTPRMGRTPMSASKRQYLNTFMSPLKSRDANVGSKTPSKLHFDTPQFLRRHTLTTVDENGEFDAPAPLRLPRKPLGRGLSEIVASLRQVEEEKADEDLEALREAEAAAEGREYIRSPSKSTARPKEDGQEAFAKDSQVPRLPLGGFDDEGMYDSPVEEEAKGHDGNPLPAFKKKGQKRTTRKANIKPTWTKRPTAPMAPDEAQCDPDSSDFDEGGKGATKPKKASQSQEGPVKKVARKVNELAHANFQRLKLRQSGRKGGPGHNSRFRRRR